MVYPALLPLMLTHRLPVVDWTDAPCRFKWTRSVSPKDEIWFLRVCHHISNAVYNRTCKTIGNCCSFLDDCCPGCSSNPTRTTDSHLKRIRSSNCFIHTAVPPDDGHRYAGNVQRLTKYTKNYLCIKLGFTLQDSCSLVTCYWHAAGK